MVLDLEKSSVGYTITCIYITGMGDKTLKKDAVVYTCVRNVVHVNTLYTNKMYVIHLQ